MQNVCLCQNRVESLMRCQTCGHVFLCNRLPCSLQHHDRVLSLVGARGAELDVNVRKGTAARVAVATAGHAAHLDGSIGLPRGEGLQTSR